MPFVYVDFLNSKTPSGAESKSGTLITPNDGEDMELQELLFVNCGDAKQFSTAILAVSYKSQTARLHGESGRQLCSL